MWLSACRKLDTIPRAESVSVPSRSKITSCGDSPGDDARRAAARGGGGQLVPLAVVSVTIPLSLTKRLDKPLPVGAVVSGDDREVW
ncbi:Uncharacterised protein [Mycobacterium tuberculosis]|uniref:Uncharacterized protein n=1 Tax=Mycobacterium tuberculosis TaxID=1773 RepID=A0A0U0UN30_MYCTX|nr:Uncharacterised protein [Mycobacterium tuberculosis]CKT70900.1 Uncharacterised protein [Mycobacterium tuberculosis]CKT71839.1 Uncharacterised protein [Mycobacterium tuberculosis]COW26193.1 Uncharacterised protein [Mycobacterium tuberculosis]COW68002.1 Uncharacterised protein [Mycobacterium tuberculosis]